MNETTPLNNEHALQVMTVRGAINPHEMGITDAHNHLWIEPVPGTPPDLPQLYDQPTILEELLDYRVVGGGAIVDCQPGGCGRDGRILAELSQASGVHVVASTGFHRQRYYPPDYWLFQASDTQAGEYFFSELESGLAETIRNGRPIRAGLIKIACEASLADTPANLLEGAAEASRRTGAAIEIHTEKGSAAEEIVKYFDERGVPPSRLVICHVDKRPDAGLHCELAQAGVLLEYDTFYRPRYEPEKNLWPLLEFVTQDGLVDAVALATDMAEAELWSRLGKGPGLAAFVTQIRARLKSLGMNEMTAQKLTGGNIAQRLARLAL